MKTLFSKIAFILLLQGFTASLYAHVELDYPQGGETFNVGQTVNIQWHIAIAHNTLNWDLLYSTDGGSTWEPIQMDLPPGSLSYAWVVPSTVTTQARVSVIQDNSATDYQDESLNFTIQMPPMPPALVVPASNITIESDLNQQDGAIQAWLDNHGGAVVDGFCGDLNWSDNFIALSDECGATGSALVTFTATDPCGSTETVATITVNDTSPPVLVNPASDLTVECDGNGNTTQLNTWIQNKAGATASDAGGSIAWTIEYTDLSNSCGASGTVSLNYTAHDECGNSVSTAAIFTIEDHLPPVVEIAAKDTTIDCGLPNTQTVLQNWLVRNGGAQASDVCGIITWTNNFPTLPDTCNGLITEWPVVFSAMDDCGNIVSTSAVVTFNEPLSGTSGSSPRAFGLKVSPNPASEILSVEMDADILMPIRLTLFDAFGNSVFSSREVSKTMYIPVQGYAPGVYYLQATTTLGTATRKVIIH